MVTQNIEKLRVLDFDDTIANTTERVRVETPDGPKLISSSEFAVYDFKPGESLDPNIAFEEFDKVDVDAASPVPFVSDLLKTFAAAKGEGRKILILTARGQAVEPHVLKFLEKRLGIKNPSSIVDVIGVGNKDPIKKVEVISEYLSLHPTIKFVSFYDDSGKNVRAVKKYLDAMGIRSDVRQVVSDELGNVSLKTMSPENITFEEEEIINEVFGFIIQEYKNMKISKRKIRNIIREETSRILSESNSEKLISLPNDSYKYKITDDDKKKTKDMGILHFTVAKGPKNVGKSFALKDTEHKLYDEAKKMHPDLSDFI